MKQFALTLCMVLLSVMFCRAQIKPLKFDKNGEFKIVQFTDVHFKYGNPASDIALKRSHAYGTCLCFFPQNSFCCDFWQP